MAFPEVYLSKPAIALPPDRLDNEEVIRRIRGNYRGDEAQWPLIEAGIQRVFDISNSQFRYLEPDTSVRVADFALRAVNQVLEENGVAATDLDMVINGSIAREYFEPATAMEVAGKLGLDPIHAFDVTSACLGMLEGLQIATAFLSLREDFDTALVCSGELTRSFLAYDVQSPKELIYKVAGLTIGNAAAAWLLRRTPFEGGCIRLRVAQTMSLPTNWHLCSTPIDGSFTSFSSDLFKLNVHVAPEIRRTIDKLGWAPDEVAHYVFHQPSKNMVDKVLTDLGVPTDRGVHTFHLYANTASTTVPIAMHQTLIERDVKPGDKIVLSSAAAGFSMATLAGEWVG
jgi:3-oxoacyl-[acyl-carrier-protein] synthase III